MLLEMLGKYHACLPNILFSLYLSMYVIYTYSYTPQLVKLDNWNHFSYWRSSSCHPVLFPAHHKDDYFSMFGLWTTVLIIIFINHFSSFQTALI